MTETNSVSQASAIMERGPDALPKRRRSYYRRLKDQLRTVEGREDAMLELASLSNAVAHFLAEEIRTARRNGIDISRAPATKMLASYLNTSRAILASFPEPTTESRTLADVVESMTRPDPKAQEPPGATETDPDVSGAGDLQDAPSNPD